MINLQCHCEKCEADWEEQDVRMVLEQSKSYQDRTEGETIRCPICGHERE